LQADGTVTRLGDDLYYVTTTSTGSGASSMRPI